MSNYNRKNVNYAFNQPFNLENPQPVIANRAPTGNDKAALGQLWIYESSNEVYVLTSIVSNVANWLLVEGSGGAGDFDSLTVNPGPTDLSTVGNGDVVIGNVTNTGDIEIVGGVGDIEITALGGGDIDLANGAGSFTITVGAGDFDIVGGGNTINIGADAAANDVFVGSTFGSSQLTLQAGVNGISMSSLGLVSVATSNATVASPTAAATINARVCKAIFTGFTTAAAATQVFTINSSFITTSSAILTSVSNLNASGNNARVTITGRIQNPGSLNISVTNNGSNPLGAADSVIITVWILT